MLKATSFLASVSLVTVLIACSDPVGDKPRATVEPAAPAAAPTTTAPAAPSAPAAGASAFAIDHAVSKVEFVGAKVTGKHDGGFKAFKGTIEANPADLTTAKVNLEIDMASTWSDSEKLTKHLMAPDFFDVAKFPTTTFTSTEVKTGADGKATITGDLTLHGVTKKISFPATVTATKDSVTAKAEFGLNRKDFNIVYPGKPDDLIKDEVLMKLDITAKPK